MVNSKNDLEFSTVSFDGDCEGYVAYQLSYQSVDVDQIYYISWSIQERQKLRLLGINYCSFSGGNEKLGGAKDEVFKTLQSDATGLERSGSGNLNRGISGIAA